MTEEMDRAKSKLGVANTDNRSIAWRLSLWSEFIKTRDAHRCVNCESIISIQAHHIFRKIVYPQGSLELGNGITLCRECHGKLHAAFNRRPDPSLPLNSQGGDDQDEISFLYGLLMDDAEERQIDQNRYYHISDEMLLMFVAYQGYQDYFDLMLEGKMSRIRCAHEIWRGAPEQWYTNLADDLLQLLLVSTPGNV